MKRLLYCLVIVLSFIGGLGWLFLHGVTSYGVYQAHGMTAGIINLSFPIVAELYWVVIDWMQSGHFWDTYSAAVTFLLAENVVVILLLLAAAGTRNDQ